MSISLSTVNTSSDTFQSWVDKYNLLIAAANLNFITANSNANGSLTTGNAFVNGIFGASTLAVSTLRGGNVQSNAVLTISSNISFTSNLFQLANTSVLSLGSISANSTVLAANIISLGNRISIGNSTVNCVITSSSITIANVTLSNLSPKIVVANNGTTIGTRGILNIVGAAVTEDANNDMLTVTISASGVSAPGSNTQLLYNDSGSLGAGAGLAFDKSTNTVLIANNLIADKVEFINGGRIRSFSCTINVTTSITIDSYTKADFRAADYVISIKDNVSNNFQCAKLLTLHDGNNVMSTEYGSLFNNTEIVALNTWTNTTHVIINCTSTSTNTTIKGIRNMVAA